MTSPTPAELAALQVAHAAAMSRDGARDLISAIIFALGSAQLLMDPETAVELARYRAAADGGLSLEQETRVRELLDAGDPLPWHAAPALLAEVDRLRHLLARSTAGDGPDAAATLVYRAEYDTIHLGHYTSLMAAQAHCEDFAQGQLGASAADSFDWIGDEDDPEEPRELVAVIDGDESSTGYVVQPVTVASVYDPEVNE
jgi:hypothetical protein